MLACPFGAGVLLELNFNPPETNEEMP